MKAIAAAVLEAELAGKAYDEDVAKDLNLAICEKIKKGVKGRLVEG